MYSGFCSVTSSFAYGAFTLFGRLSQNLSAWLHESALQSEPQNISILVWPLSRSLAATYDIDVSFFSSGYLDVSVHRVPFRTLWIGVRIHEGFSCGFPHSDICGLSDICSSPQLFAAYHVFLRLLVPRHPPCALFCLTSRCIALQLLLLSCNFRRFFNSYVFFTDFILCFVFLGCLDFLFLKSIFSVWSFQGTYIDLSAFYCFVNLWLLYQSLERSASWTL